MLSGLPETCHSLFYDSDILGFRMHKHEETVASKIFRKDYTLIERKMDLVICLVEVAFCDISPNAFW